MTSRIFLITILSRTILVYSHLQYYADHPKVFSNPQQQPTKRRALQEYGPLLEGDPVCRCLLPDETDSVEPSHLDMALTDEFASASSNVNLTTYGFGCYQHDAMREVCRCADASSGTACASVPRWCFQEWCWVDPQTCQLKHDRWTEVVSSSSSSPEFDGAANIRFYSYATCLNEDTYTSDMLKKQLSQRTIRVAFAHNAGGYLGVSSKTGKIFSDDATGAMLDFMNAAADRANFTIKVVQPSMQYVDRARSVGATSQNDYCIYMASLGFTDVCLGMLLLTNVRTSIADWMVMGEAEIKLIVPLDKKFFTSGIDRVLLAIETVFSPFTIPCWAFITMFVVPVLGGLLFVVHEYGRPGSVYPKYERITRRDEDGQEQAEKREYSYLRHAVLSYYTANLGLWQTAYQSRVTSMGGMIHLLGFSFFVFAFVAVYAANLSAILIQRRNVQGINSLNDVVDRKLRICTIRKFYEIVSVLHNIPDSFFAVDPVNEGGDGKPGFDCPRCAASTRVFDFIDPDKAQTDERYCHVGLHFEHALTGFNNQNSHCNKTAVGAGIGGASYGFPIFEFLSDELRTVMYELKNEGLWFTMSVQAKPENQCDFQYDSTVKKDPFALSIEELSGIWFGTAVFASLGLIATGIMQLRTCLRVNRGVVTPVYDQFGLPVDSDDDDGDDDDEVDPEKEHEVYLSEMFDVSEDFSRMKDASAGLDRSDDAVKSARSSEDRTLMNEGHPSPHPNGMGTSRTGLSARRSVSFPLSPIQEITSAAALQPTRDSDVRKRRKKKKDKKRRKEVARSHLDRLLSNKFVIITGGDTVVSELTGGTIGKRKKGKPLRPIT